MKPDDTAGREAPGTTPDKKQALQSLKPDEVQDGLAKAPGREPAIGHEKMMGEMMGMMVQMGSAPNPLHSRLTPEHISQVLSLAVKQSDRQYELRSRTLECDFSEKQSKRRYIFWGFFLVLAVTVLALFLFQSRPEVLVPILTGIGGLLSGLVGGYGLGRRSN